MCAELLLVVLTCSFLCCNQFLRKDRAEHKPTVDLSIKNTVKVATVRNGKVVYEVERRDPWVKNFVVLLAREILGIRSSLPPLYASDGSATDIDWEYNVGETLFYPHLAVGLGASNVSWSPDQYYLVSPFCMIQVNRSNIELFQDNGYLILKIDVFYTNTRLRQDLGEVGLFWMGLRKGGTPAPVLLSREPLPSVVQLYENDSVLVTYIIDIPMASVPFTQNLVSLIINYIFGLKYYNLTLKFTSTDGSQQTTFDTGYCKALSTCYPSGRLVLGSGQHYSPEVYRINGSVLAESRIGEVTLLWNGSHYVLSTFTRVNLPTGGHVREVAYTITVDVDPTSNLDIRDVVLLYFPVSVNIPVDGGFVFKFELVLRTV